MSLVTMVQTRLGTWYDDGSKTKEVVRMSPAPPWTRREFRILLEHPELSDEELSHQLPKRSTGAIKVVRDFIHNFHRGGDASGLSKMMISRLEQGSWACPRCNQER